jgi:hypothetical protein
MESLEVHRGHERALASELRLVREAILLVASSGSPRVVVANLRHGRRLMEPASEIAADAGVTLEILETGRGRRVDLAAVADGVRPT